MEFTREEILEAYKRYFFKRADLGYTDSDVSKIADIDAGCLCKWKKGTTMPRERTLFKISNVLGCKVTDLICA